MNNSDPVYQQKPLLEQVFEVTVVQGNEPLPKDVHAQFECRKATKLPSDYELLLKNHYETCKYDGQVDARPFEAIAQFVVAVQILGQTIRNGSSVCVFAVNDQRNQPEASFGAVVRIFRHKYNTEHHYFAMVRFYKPNASANDSNPNRFAAGVELWSKAQYNLDEYSLVPLLRIHSIAATYNMDCRGNLIVTLLRRIVLHV
ncbi:hypothetical protein BC940DRAFT_331676 [Gongronella butleri]|nr:hypothetical protein BC940DRAFT_331676 [Gongronella butleri]